MGKDAYADFMAQAYTMELEATERYAQFAEQLDTHNNRGVAEMFRKLSAIEALHAKRILEEMGWPSLPALPAAFAWDPGEGPEAAPLDSIHYLMQPYHALEIALANEERAAHFFGRLADIASLPDIREAAMELRDEERAHVALVKEWMQKVDKPDGDWALDPDPPRYTD
jgi:rubrerythrin